MQIICTQQWFKVFLSNTDNLQTIECHKKNFSSVCQAK